MSHAITLQAPHACFQTRLTYNLTSMAAGAGLYEALYTPATQGWTTAGDLIAPLSAGLQALRQAPAYFQALEPPRRCWGTVEALVECAMVVLAACRTWPEAVIVLHPEEVPNEGVSRTA